MKIGPLVIIRNRKKVSAKDVVRAVLTTILSEDEYLRGMIAKSARAIAKDYVEETREAEVEHLQYLSHLIESELIFSEGEHWTGGDGIHKRTILQPWERRLALAVAIAKDHYNEMAENIPDTQLSMDDNIVRGEN